MSKEPLVSVIMNCFNGEKYLREAIDSVLAQTHQNWEIIFWDNQSTDGSAEIVQRYADPRIKYFFAPVHTWLYEARNYAIEKASGEFLAFLDVDDWWLPTKLTKQVSLFRDDEVGMVCANYWAVSEKKNKNWIMFDKPIPTGWVLSDLLKFYFPGLLTLVIRRCAYDSLSYGCDPRFHIIGDLDLVVRLSVNWKMDCIQEPLAHYRLHGNNETAKHSHRQIGEMSIWMSEMARLEVVRQSSGWKVLINNHTYLAALNRILNGDKRSGRELLHALPLGELKLRLLVALCLPHRIVLKIKN